MNFKKIRGKWLWVGATGALTLLAGVWLLSGDADHSQDVPMFPVQKGDLQVNVLQGGEIRALRNDEIRSEIETSTKIISIIPEGYLVTEKDIQQEKVLVELDNSEIRNRIQDHEIQFQSTVAAYIEADEAREIQRSENLSLAREQRQTALFALMDFEKYLGKQVAAEILEASNLPNSADAFDSIANALEEENVMRAPSEDGEAPRSVTSSLDTEESVARRDFSEFLSEESNSDGEAQQKLRQLRDELLLSQSELAVAKQKVESSERLVAKDFVPKAQLENDQVNLEKVQLSVKTAETQLDLFKKYEFPKECEQMLSSYREALNKLRRIVRANRSKMAQAESKFQTAKRRYDMELAKKEDLERQLRACTIRASTSGLVAYGDLNSSNSFNREPIEEGATVRLRQTILTIPDMKRMGVRLNVHESQVKKVRPGQPVRVTVDAEPGKVLTGTVAELAVLPDSSSSRYTPNLKVYPCSIHIEGTHPWLKPGMNAKVEIIVEQLAEVVYVPVQSIEVENDHHFCYVEAGGKMERREITTGSFNEEFIEVREGLLPGDKVALALPKRATTTTGPAVPAAAETASAGGVSSTAGTVAVAR
jgi:HlyD family secretion protein